MGNVIKLNGCILLDESIMEYIDDTSHTALEIATSVWATMQSNEFKVIDVRPSDSNGYIMLFRHYSSAFGKIIYLPYNSDEIKMSQTVNNGTTWTSWKSITFS